MRIGKVIFVIVIVLAIFAGDAIGQLTGDKTVGSGGDYADLPSAISALNSNGVGGPVRFLLLDETYILGSTTLRINVTTNSPNAVNTVTIKPSTGVTPEISRSTTGLSSVMSIDATNYVIIDGSNTDGGSSRDLTIQNTGSGVFCLLIGSNGTTPITNITVKNCNIYNSSPGTAASGNAAVFVSDNSGNPDNPGYFSDLTFDNNAIGNASFAILCNGAVPATGSDVNVRWNNLGGSVPLLTTGVKLLGVDGALVSGNNISNFETTEGTLRMGLWLDGGTRNVTVAGNIIHDIRYTGGGGWGGMGIAVVTDESSNNITILNNMIYDITGSGRDISDGNIISTGGNSPVGIYVGPRIGGSGSQSGVSIYYNTIHLTGNTLNTSGAYSLGIALASGSSATIMNNIVVNNLGVSGSGVGAVAVYAAGSGQLSSSDYNDYYCASSSTNVVGKIGGTDYTTLAGLQDATGADGNSSSTNVTFLSSSDLHLTGGSIGDPLLAGIPIGGITTDFDGDTRDATNPYMGADEADVPLPITLAEFTAMVEPGSDHIRLSWATLSEINNYGFFIQRRQGHEGVFSDIPGGFVVGHGTTSEPQQYTYMDTTVTSGTWYYQLKQVDLNGAVHLSEPVQVGVVTGMEEVVPVEYNLSQNYPNPFNPSTVISYGLPNGSHVSLEVYNALGQLVEQLVDKEHEPGQYQVRFDAKGLSAGVYYYRLTAEDFVSTKKLLLLK
ncbi:MAG: T9SS type A sorting domain-containing protein [Bacteroidota bacterium]